MASDPRTPTQAEQATLAQAPAWTRAFTGNCSHELVRDYRDGTVECDRCGITPPADGDWVEYDQAR